MTVLLGLVGLYIFQSQHTPTIIHDSITQTEPLEGEDEIRNISIKPVGHHRYTVEVDYRFRGDFNPGWLRASALQTPSSSPLGNISGQYNIRQGVNTATLPLWRDASNSVAHSTRIVRVEMLDKLRNRVVASKDLEYPIDWPQLGYAPKPTQDMHKDVDTLYKEAVAEIDSSTKTSLQNARVKLENIISKDAGFLPVYPELARYHMKTNWGPEGLRQAERALVSGLEIDPDHANSHVLIGYVYAHQGRYQEANDAFVKANHIGTDNLWLWANWGELLLMQGQVADSIEMYSKAVDSKRPYNTYDRARKDAYKHLINIHRLGDDVEKENELHLKRIAEYGTEVCFPFYYATFRKNYFDDADIVLKYAKQALDANCQYTTQIRKVLGIAYYSKWITATTPEEIRSNLTQA